MRPEAIGPLVARPARRYNSSLMRKRKSNTFTRREFIAKTSAAGIALARAWNKKSRAAFAAPGASPQNSAADPDLASLKGAFLNPPNAARPMTRWWWFGGAVTPQEITRELTFMKEAGLKGAEIQPVYPVEVDEPERSIHNIRYFSDDWFDVLRHTVDEARRLGLQLDFTLGSGWPYGGPFIPAELAARRLRMLSQDVAGPTDFSWDLTPHLVGEEKIVAALLVPVLPSEQPDLSRSKVMTDQLKEIFQYNNRVGLHIGRWKIPPGEWRVMVVIDTPTGMSVKRPTLGMEGYVLDHFSREAIELFLGAAGDRTLGELTWGAARLNARATEKPPFHSIFCDSLEVYGADWTSRFLDEFRRRRGYDLAPLLPALWQDAGLKTPHIRYDYHLTLSDLIRDDFFRPLVAWVEKNGMQARIQAHGAFGDVMQGYSLANIPEGENIFLGDRYLVNVHHRRLASSAAHVYGKPLVSAETYTWLRVPLYLETLEMMKAATDASFLDGVNHIVNHGYPYSPPEAGEPGWVFYASSLINHNNTWWRHYPHLVRYIHRALSLLQQGAPVNPIAVHLPLSDIFAQFGAGGLHIDVEIEDHLGTEFFNDLRRAGYDFDLINDHALASVARVEGGKLRAGTGIYAAVLVPATTYMPPESLERLEEFAASGGLVIFMGRLPEAAPGLAEQGPRTARVRSALKRLWGDQPPTQGRAVTSGKGKVVWVAESAAALDVLKSELAPDFSIVEAGDASEHAKKLAVETVGFLHRHGEGVDNYFVANVSEHPQELRVRFSAGHKAPERWNPENGSIEESLVYEFVELPGGKGKATEAQLRLEPFESCFIVFGPSARPPLVTRTDSRGPLRIERIKNRTQVSGLVAQNGEYSLVGADGKSRRFRVKDIPTPRTVEGPWKLALGDRPSLTLARLESWTELPEGKGYSGWATYETTIDVADLSRNVDWFIDLGRVHETAEVILNGVNLGARWKAPRRLVCRDALKVGSNHLKIEVANLWIHAMRARPKPDYKILAETFGIRWGRYGEVEPESVPRSGLLGPVRLVPLKRWTVSF